MVIGKMYGELYLMDDEIYEIDCEVCEVVCEVVLDQYLTEEAPAFCPMCGSPVTGE